jgi:hypothetical protein
MKKLTTIVFAALVAVTLSLPAWAQTQAPAPNNPPKTTEKPSKADKKQAKPKKEKKSKNTTSKDANKNSTNTTK